MIYIKLLCGVSSSFFGFLDTSHVFGYANDIIVVTVHGVYATNPHLLFNVVVITPHSGYATVNQTDFVLYNSSLQVFMKQTELQLLGTYVMPVGPGSSEQSFNLAFNANIFPVVGYLESRNMTGLSGVFGSVGLAVTYHDEQLSSTQTFAVEIPVQIDYNIS